MATLGHDEIRVLEQTRQRLSALYTSLTTLQQDLYTQQPLPSWSSLQSHASLISNNLQTMSQQLSDNQTFLSSLVAFPLPQYPGHIQGHIIEQMLRTKFEPEVVDWVEQGQEIAAQQQNTTKPKSIHFHPSTPRLADKELDELWQWAPSAANAEARKQKWGADYTLAEKEMGVENVVTGLRRELLVPPDDIDEGDEDEYEEITDEDEDSTNQGDKMDVVEVRSKPGAAVIGVDTSTSNKPAVRQMPLESVHKFMMTGLISH